MVIPLPLAAGLLSDLLWLAKEPHPPPSSHPPLFWRPRSNLIQQGTALQGSCNRDSGPGWTCKGLALLGRQLWLLYLRWWQPHHQKRQGRGVLSSSSLRVKKDTPCPPHPHPGAWSSTVETHKPEACPRCSVSHLSPKYPIPSPWIPSCHIENLVKQENFQLCKHWESFRQWRATLVITMANLKCQWSLNDIVQREKNTKKEKEAVLGSSPSSGGTGRDLGCFTQWRVPAAANSTKHGSSQSASVDGWVYGNGAAI